MLEFVCKREYNKKICKALSIVIYAESLIAVKYRVRTKDGTMLGGAMYALERGLGMRFWAILFACFGVLTSFGIGCGVQVRESHKRHKPFADLGNRADAAQNHQAGNKSCSSARL